MTRRLTYEQRCLLCYEYFALGLSTAVISKVFDIPEAAALCRVTIGRSLVRGLPVPYKLVPGAVPSLTVPSFPR